MNKFLTVAAVFAAGSLLSAKATTLADWTFETSQPATAGPFSPEVGSGSASGSHAGASVYSTPAGNGSVHSFSSTLWAVGDYYQFQVSTTGYDDITLAFDQTSSSTGPGTFKISYSTDGTSFTDFANYTVLQNGLAPNASWNATTASSAYTFNSDLSSVLTIDNASTVYFRLIDTSTTSAGGATVGTGGTDRLDNFTVGGTAVAVPEPTSIALASIGGLACLIARRRRA